MPRFLFIGANEFPHWGGSELLWSLAAEKMARQGLEVRASVPHFARELPLVKQLRSAGCHVFYRQQFPPFFYRLARKIWPLPEYALTHVRSLAKGFDLVIISQGQNSDGLIWMEAAEAAGLPYATIAEGAAELFWPVDSDAKRIAKSYEGARSAYFVSEFTLRLSCRQFATSLQNGKVIRNPFNVRYDAHPPWPSEVSDQLSLACVARLDAGTKGLDVLLDVLSLPRWRERNVRVSLVGGGLNGHALRHLATHLRLSNVEFAGHSNNIEEVWSRHHALVLPSRFEGMPLTVVEAMLCGRPCIATDVGGNRELIRDGINGFLARAPTVEFLDEAMNRAWENRSRLKEMGEQAAYDVRNFVAADPAEDFVRELLSLVSESRVP